MMSKYQIMMDRLNLQKLMITKIKKGDRVLSFYQVFLFLSSLSNENDNQQLDSSKDNGRSQLCLSSAEHGKSSDSAVHFVKENVGYLKNGVHLNSVQDGNVFKGVQLSNEL